VRRLPLATPVGRPQLLVRRAFHGAAARWCLSYPIDVDFEQGLAALGRADQGLPSVHRLSPSYGMGWLSPSTRRRTHCPATATTNSASSSYRALRPCDGATCSVRSQIRPIRVGVGSGRATPRCLVAFERDKRRHRRCGHSGRLKGEGGPVRRPAGRFPYSVTLGFRVSPYSPAADSFFTPVTSTSPKPTFASRSMIANAVTSASRLIVSVPSVPSSHRIGYMNQSTVRITSSLS
jgi:hypothetical protein